MTHDQPSNPQPQVPSVAAVLEALALAWLLYCAQHRLRIALLLTDLAGSSTPTAVWQSWAQAWTDLPILAVLWTGALALRGGLHLVPARSRTWPGWSVLGLMLATPVLGLIGSHQRGWLRVMEGLHEGVSWALVRETATSGELATMLAELGPGDVFDILLPIAVLLLAWPLRRSLGPLGDWRRKVAVGLILLWPWPGLLAPQWSSDVAPEVTANPAVYTLWDGWQRDFAPPDPPDPAQTSEPAAAAGAGLPAPVTPAAFASGGMRLAGPGFAAAVDPPPSSAQPSGKQWNIVWLVLESTGRRYLQEAAPEQQPMPTLRALAKQGWDLVRHRSPSNSSATSIFAQFSGLYPSPTTWMFAIQPDVAIPSLFQFLGPAYETFLYTPSKLSFFFPRAFLQAGGLHEMVGFDQLPDVPRAVSTNPVRDEAQVVTRFLQRLDRAKPPFAAVYYSYAAHFEYLDHGPDARPFGTATARQRYLNDLRFLDSQIARIVEHLRAKGLLDSTILVLAGDHGEAFGQHPRNWTHSRASYEENLATPAVLWQPALFAPKAIDLDTSHVDLLPTVLDALGIAYEDKLLQGESLFRTPLRRKAQFFWGNEGNVTLLTANRVKVQWHATEQRCQAWDLAHDPMERRPLGCDRYRAEAELLRKWQSGQRRRLLEYNAACKNAEALDGLRHPAPR